MEASEKTGCCRQKALQDRAGGSLGSELREDIMAQARDLSGALLLGWKWGRMKVLDKGQGGAGEELG